MHKGNTHRLSENFGRPGRTSDENIKWDQDSGDSRLGNERMHRQVAAFTVTTVQMAQQDDAPWARYLTQSVLGDSPILPSLRSRCTEHGRCLGHSLAADT